MKEFVQNVHKLAGLKEERAQREQEVAVVEQVLTLSAVNRSDTFTTTLELV